jgi:hypothetical protein
MAQTVLPQLKEISADLVAQEASLMAQLSQVQEKLRGVRAILPLFGESSADFDFGSIGSEDVTEEPVQRATAVQTRVKSTATKAAKAAKSTKTKASKPARAAKADSAKSAAKKKDGRAASWQKYTRPGVKETSIPEAVRLVLETQPDKSFKIAEVMDALFNETMPKSQHLKARNRISNVLSGGVRSGEWYKGERGTYRLSGR